MAAKKGKGLLLVLVDVPADKEEEFNRWYNEEHLWERLTIPGFLTGARYVAVSGAPKYLTCYELDTPEAMGSPEYRRQQENPTHWTKRISPSRIGAEFISNVYQQIFPAQVSHAVAQSDMAPVLQVGRMEVPVEIEDEFNEWYNAKFLPDFENVPGCIRGRRFRSVTGGPKYLTVYEFEHEEVSHSADWAAARHSHPQSAQVLPRIENAPGSPGIYKKIFPL